MSTSGIKGIVSNSYPLHFFQIQETSPRGPLASHSVRAGGAVYSSVTTRPCGVLNRSDCDCRGQTGSDIKESVLMERLPATA